MLTEPEWPVLPGQDDPRQHVRPSGVREGRAFNMCWVCGAVDLLGKGYRLCIILSMLLGSLRAMPLHAIFRQSQ